MFSTNKPPEYKEVKECCNTCKYHKVIWSHSTCKKYGVYVESHAICADFNKNYEEN